jgi:hypothetical protein
VVVYSNWYPCEHRDELYYTIGGTPEMRSALYLAACIRVEEKKGQRREAVVYWLTDPKVTKSTVTGRKRPVVSAGNTRPAVSEEVIRFVEALISDHQRRFPSDRFPSVGFLIGAMNEKVCIDVPYTIAIESEWTFYSDVVDAYATEFVRSGTPDTLRDMMDRAAQLEKSAAQLEETTAADMDCV